MLAAWCPHPCGPFLERGCLWARLDWSHNLAQHSPDLSGLVRSSVLSVWSCENKRADQHALTVIDFTLNPQQKNWLCSSSLTNDRHFYHRDHHRAEWFTRSSADESEVYRNGMLLLHFGSHTLRATTEIRETEITETPSPLPPFCCIWWACNRYFNTWN